jgi:acylphosphatase
MSEQARLRALVQGFVQGVSFRWHTRQRAGALGLTGFVRNLPTGGVEVVAEGNRNEVQDLLNWLYEGPAHAIVEQVEANWEPPTNQFRNFEVRY